MKRIRNVFAFLLALVMVMGLGTTAFAATVTINGEDIQNHTFYAYKVFGGDESAGVLSNVVEGNVPFSELLAALQADDSALKASFPATQTVDDGNGGTTTQTITYTPASVAEIIANWPAETKTSNAEAFAKIVYNVITTHNADTSKTAIAGTQLDATNGTELADGYYLIVDQTQFADGDTGTARNASLLQVVGTAIVINTKTDKPTVEKLIQEDKNTGEGRENWGGHGDYEIGQEINFRFNSVLPDMSHYSTYKYIFHDDMSDGLTFVDGSLSVKITWDDGECTIQAKSDSVTDGYTLVMADEKQDAAADADGDDFELTIEDLKKIEAAIIADTTNTADSQTTFTMVVNYKGKLNDDAIIGLYGTATPDADAQTGNPNTVYLEYSNNPDGDGTGRTEEDTVYAFTFELDGDKINGNNETLAGAEFYLYKETATAVGDAPTGTAQTGYTYSEAKKITAKYAVVDTDSDNEITDWTVTGWVDSENTYYKVTDGDGNAVWCTDVTNVDGTKLEAEPTLPEPPTDATKFTTGDDGQITVKGLDADDVYYLQETKAPEGYNLLTAPVSLHITSTYTNDLLSIMTLTVNGGASEGGVVNTGVATVEVTNNKGSELPQTGATGTILFITFGSLAAIGAAVLMITKKKMTIYED